MSSLMHRHMWATPLAAGLRLSPWEVHQEGSNCREFYRLQAKFTRGTKLSAGYQVRADGALYPWPEAHLEEGNCEHKTRLGEGWAPPGFICPWYATCCNIRGAQRSLGSLSNDDADGNENGKKAIGLISKTTTLHVHHAFFVHFFAVVARQQRESAWIHVLSRTGTQNNNFLFFSWTLIQSFRIQLEKHLRTFEEVNEME